MLKKLTFVYTTTSTLYSFNRFDNFGLFSWIEVCCFWRGNNNAFINTDGLEIIFYRHSDGSHLCLQACSTCTNQTVKWVNKFFWMKEIELYFFFKIFYSNECSFPLQSFCRKHKSEKYFSFTNHKLQLVLQSLNISKSNVHHVDSTSIGISGNQNFPSC